MLAERYLIETRRLVLPADVSPRVLRFHPRCPFEENARHPCLIALYRDILTDAPAGIMRSALTQDGRKIDRKALGEIRSAAIKLTDDVDVPAGLVVGEGLETTLAGLMEGFAPAWALAVPARSGNSPCSPVSTR
jgi:putative DNA primase/helicase